MRREVADHHQLRVDELVDVLFDAVGDHAHAGRQIVLHFAEDGFLHRRRKVVPELRILGRHDSGDHAAHFTAGDVHQVLGDAVRVQDAIEIGDAADFREGFVDGDRRHLLRPRGDDALPTESAVAGDRGDHLNAPGEEREEQFEAGHFDPVEVDRRKQHQDARPIGDVPDDSREQRNGDQLFEQVVRHRRTSSSYPRTSRSDMIAETSLFVGVSLATAAPSQLRQHRGPTIRAVGG